MKRFLRNIALFALPFAGLLVWLLAAPYDKGYAYKQILKDCRSGSWIYRRLFQNEKPVELAFVGTSKTMCDVDDSLLQARLLAEHGIRLHTANLGVCRKGENLHYLIARDLFARKSPKYLIAEVSMEMAPNSHSHFPYLAETHDVLFPTLIFNNEYFHDIGALAWNRLIHHRERLLGIGREYDDHLPDPDHSFLRVPDDVVADSAEMARIRGIRKARLRASPPEESGGGLLHELRYHFPKRYYERIRDLCEAHGTRLILLYLPVYGHSAHPPRDMAFYRSLGDVWLPPDSVFGDPRLHFDHSHLNQAGARAFSAWLTARVAALHTE